MTLNKLEFLAYRLDGLSSLRNLFSELNFDFEDKPVNKDSWNTQQKEMVSEARIIASKSGYQIYYIQTNTDSLKEWKGISTKIIKENTGFCMVCSHNPSGVKWIFSSLSKQHSQKFSETRHVPIDIKPGTGVPKTFVEFLDKIRVTTESTALSIHHQMSDAFDSFAVQIHNELTVNVFEALKILSKGIISDKSNNMTLDKQSLEDIREPIFILLYRIIFILYAEDRGIFPVDNKIYHEKFSLKWLKQEWLLKNTENKTTEYGVLDRLEEFFRLIEMGSENMGYDSDEFFMKSYYGRLFDRKIHSKLNKWKIKNKYLLDAISLLTRTRDKKGNYFFLDYSALETRHLGSVYEHLLEYHLTIKDKKIADLPDAKDRKTSGSYYTPQYIVDYIVENTVGPLIDDIVKNNPKNEHVDKILELNILDPAMGSGHFLIGVTNYMARRICEIEYDKEYLESAFIERKRDVVRRCIYGVDLNPLAVDLAQVSLWLETLSSEKPLSFLSAHLKSGNSLIGSNIDAILDKQTTLMESSKGRTRFKKTVKDFIMLEQSEDDTASAVKTKTEKYDEIKSKGTIYYDLKFLLDAKVAKDFGIDVPIGDYVAKIGENSLDFHVEGSAWQRVKESASEHSFFHWDLEFPDIFYDDSARRKENPGFDGVVGNPPYVRQESLRDKKSMQLSKEHTLNLPEKFVVDSKSDLSCYFHYHALNLLKNKGVLGFISSDSFLHFGYGKNVRKSFLDNCDILEITKTNFNVFEGADIPTCILLLKKSQTKNHNALFKTVNKRGFENDNFTIVEKLQKNLLIDNWNNYFSNVEFNPKIPMVQMSDTGIIKRGKTTGCNDFFVLTSETIKEYSIAEKYYEPIISRDIHEGVLTDNDATEYLLNVNESKGKLVKTEEGKYVLRYIVKVGENIKVIPKKSKNQTPCMISELSSVKSHRPYWYSLKLDNPPAIFLGRFANEKMKFYENNGNFYARDNFAYFTPNNAENTYAFLAYLSSSWVSLYLEKNGHPAGGGALQFLTGDYKNSTVPDFDEIGKEDVENMKKAWRNYHEDFDQKKLDSVVLNVLGFTPEEIAQMREDLEDIRGKRLNTKK